MNNQTVENEMMKLCSKCKIQKLTINFHKNKSTENGLYNQGILCRKQNYNENLKKVKKYCLDNRDQILKNTKTVTVKFMIKLILVQRLILILDIKRIVIFV